jgi:hypothetical protein
MDQEQQISFRHLERLTDDTGILEHSLGTIPRRKEGYTTDDNARALWACLEWLELAPDDRAVLQRLMETYLSFLLWAQRDDGLFHNNFDYARRPEKELPSDDCTGRALWALALTLQRFPDERYGPAAKAMLSNGAKHIASMSAPRGWAYALAACSVLHQIGNDALPQSAGLVNNLEEKLLQLYRTEADHAWRWFEPVMSYGNGLLPWSLFHAYTVTGRTETLRVAQTALHFLIEKMIAPQGWIRPIGNEGWCTKTTHSLWDQQPLDVMKLALAAELAYFILRLPEYREVVAVCRQWFHGHNDGGVPLADPADGSCCDGLTRTGPNLNRGAESTLSYLLTEAIYVRVHREVKQHESSEGHRLAAIR